MRPFLVVIAIILTMTSPALASGSSDAIFGLWGGYSYTDGAYVDRLEKDFPEDVNRNQYAAGFEFWGGTRGILHIGFMGGVQSHYAYDKTMKAVKTGDTWQTGGTVSHHFDLTYITLPFLFTARLMLTDGLYIGGGTGISLALKKPAIDGQTVPQYGDDGLGAMVIAGYDIRISRGVLLGLNFRTIWGFQHTNTYISYIPGISISFEL